MSESKKKCQQYSIEYLKYGFIQSPTNQLLPMCLICKKVFSNEAIKPSRQEHLTKMHADQKDKDLSYFQVLEEKYFKHPTISKLFESSTKQGNDGLQASYISLLIAKAGKLYTIGEELILPAIKEVINTVLHKPASDIIRKIPLSNNSVQRRIDEMAEDVEKLLCDYLKTCQFFIQLNESTLPNNEALLLSYVRFIKEEKVCQELLFIKNLEADTKGESIFNTMNKFFQEKDISICSGAK